MLVVFFGFEHMELLIVITYLIFGFFHIFEMELEDILLGFIF